MLWSRSRKATFKCFFGSVPKCSESFRLRPNIIFNVGLNIIPCYEIRKWYWFLVREAGLWDFAKAV